MSFSRTLLRRITKQRVTLPDGQVIFADLPAKPKRTRPGTPHRRIIATHTGVDAIGGYEASFHATKGSRRVRLMSA